MVVTSNAGQDQHPAWLLNVQANPSVDVQVGKESREMRARVATPEERAELWPQIIDWWKGYVRYESKTRREIPLVILKPSVPPS